MRIDYETDFYLWALEQAELLRQKQFSAIDSENLAEEIEDVARHSKREVAHRLEVLIQHLLKWQYQPKRRGNSWTRTIIEQRHQLEYDLDEMPSLRRLLNDSVWMNKRWHNARRAALDETRVKDIPQFQLWTPEQLLNPDFYPH
jgi:hypothetical protein